MTMNANPVGLLVWTQKGRNPPSRRLIEAVLTGSQMTGADWGAVT